ncbi:DUF2382 domain-containing protein [Nonomuraea sp. KC401]|uniref:DUF2382 domain-containing protein n=1 Tax=unclassified Nonomuraea TaxID=2593643 RepID=UPI0010FDB4FE|nr:MULTISPECIES: PRC and DUF2382 domain-containing protein [unclassified Nonomuraea]NBE94757.1 DUF2382 domain-containing protein [Nonomuraea sp. K271]TLF64974.1 DUF2382 domain-containing protein [Nonomuraea sp. KC401]
METEIRNLLDCHVVGSDGQSIGKVGQVYLNDRSGEPEWVTVRTGLFGMKQTFVPLANARRSGEEIKVPFDKEMIKGAPNIDVDDRLTIEEEADLYRYYGMRPSSVPQQRAGEPRTAKTPVTGDRPERPKPTGSAGAPRDDLITGGPAGGTAGKGGAEGATGETGRRDFTGRTAGPDVRGERVGGDLADEQYISMTRSEERLRIGKESRETGRVRLHKYVDTETVHETVPLSREEVVIEREAVHEGDTTAAHEAEIGEEDREMILHEERPVVGKETRPVERIRVSKRDVQHEETVEGQIRKERLEIDEDGASSERGEGEMFGHRGSDLPPER